MEEEFIPYRNERAVFENARRRFLSSDEISESNKRLVLRFIDDAALGKTIFGRAKKKVGFLRLHSYITHLSSLIRFAGKDLDQLEQADMESFIRALEGGEIFATRDSVCGRPVDPACFPLSQRTIVDRKVAIRKFYKWLWGRSRVFPPIVEWIDTSFEAKEVPALTALEVEQMLDHAKTNLQRALIQVLFDGGFRRSELFNIRLRHLRLEQVQSKDGPRECFLARVPFSKTERRTVALPMEATTKWLARWLMDHPERPKTQRDGTIRAGDVDAQLFPIGKATVNKMLRRIGREALGKRVWPHLMRHTSATWWANNGLPYFKLCKRFGWTMTSAMAKRYIDRAGVNELDTARIYFESAESRSGAESRESEVATRKAAEEKEAAAHREEPSSPFSILRTRLARGEIALDAYRALVAELRLAAEGHGAGGTG